MKPNPIHIPVTFETSRLGFSVNHTLDGMTAEVLDKAGANIVADLEAQNAQRVAEMLCSAASGTATTSKAPTAAFDHSDLLKMCEQLEKNPPPRHIVGVTTRPEARANVEQAVQIERQRSVPSVVGMLSFPILSFLRQQEPVLVFYDRAAFLRHVALMEMEVGDIVVPRYRCYALHSGAGYYSDAVVASLDPFVLISRGGDMRWSATVKPEHYQKVERADEETLKRVLARLERDKAEGGL